MDFTEPPKLSILVPLLNSRTYISECMDSITTQTLKNIEIICIDAGSTDGTLEVLEAYAAKDSRITIIHSDIKSYGYQMNLGIAAAKGSYIGIVESDDYVSIDMYEKLYSFAKDTDADFVKGGHTSFFGLDDEKVLAPFPIINCEDLYGKCVDLNVNRHIGMYALTHIWAGIYKRSFLLEKELWFHESPGASYQDTSFSILVGLTANTCVYTGDCSYYYRIDNAASSVKSDSKVECVRDEYTYVYDYLVKHDIMTADIRLLVDRYKLITYKWNYKRLPAQGRGQFVKAITEEMKPYLPGGTYADILNNYEQEWVKLLTDTEYAKSIMLKEEETELVYQKLFLKITAGTRFVIMGAGVYFQLMIWIQEILKKNYIIGVCDNNIALQGTEKLGYRILSVEEAIESNREAEWLVTNRNHSDEMVLQLRTAQIPLNKIYIINKAIDRDNLLKIILSNKASN